ncbi:hypothetical protein AB0L59_39600 [Streptomyces sp. NPDC052109]|uniref:hypothetical protein n=1 Tax=Streptomyces sp. NPDC052109 TaxID=3155527 RepID=UPI00344192D7
MDMDVLATGSNGAWMAADEYLTMVARVLAARGYCALPEVPDHLWVRAGQDGAESPRGTPQDGRL